MAPWTHEIQARTRRAKQEQWHNRMKNRYGKKNRRVPKEDLGFDSHSKSQQIHTSDLRFFYHSRKTKAWEKPTRHVSSPSSNGQLPKFFWASLDSHVRRLDSVNLVTLMYTRSCWCPRCQLPRLVILSPDPSVQASCLSVTASSPSVRHVSTWPSPHRRPSPQSFHTCTSQAKRHVA